MDEEIRHFRALGRVDRIIGVLLGGGPSREAFPPAMFEPRTAGAPPEEPLFVALADERGRRTRRSRHVARVRLVARMIGVEFDVLYRRELRRRRRDRAIALTVVAVALAAFGFLLHGLQTEREGRELADRRVATVASEKTSLITERADARARGERERRHRLATTLAVREIGRASCRERV